MEELVLETFDDVKFIQGATKMNQTNWQGYFGTTLPNGVYEGLRVQDYYGEASFGYPKIITDGSVFVNGLLAQIHTDEGYTEIGDDYWDGAINEWATQGESALDRFICIRVYLNEEKAQIVQKSGIAEFNANHLVYNENVTEQLNKFIQDESYCCTRNEYIWDVPIFYQAARGSVATVNSYGRTLRRVVNLNWKPTHNYVDIGAESKPDAALIVSGKNPCSCTTAWLDQGQTHKGAYVFMDGLDYPEGAVISINCAAGDEIRLVRGEWVNDCANNLMNQAYGYGAGYKHTDSTNWDVNGLIYTVPSDTQVVRMRFTYLDIEKGGQDLAGAGITHWYDFRNYLVEVL